MKKLSIILIGALLLLSSSQSHAAWVKIGGGPQNGLSRINGFYYGTDSTGLKRAVACGTEAGVSLSMDSGISWSPYNGSPKNVVSLGYNVAVTSDSGLFDKFAGQWRHVGYFQLNPILAVASTWTSYLMGTNNGVYYANANSTRTDVIGLTNRNVMSLSASYYANDPISQSFWWFVFAGTDSGVFFANYGIANPPVQIPRQPTWVSRNNGLTNKNAAALTSLFAFNVNSVLAGTADNGVFISRDTGKSWTSFSEGLINKNVTALVFGDPTVPYAFAATFTNNIAAIWRRPLSDITSNTIAKGNRITGENIDVIVNNRILKYMLPKMSEVKIRIFDLNGKLMYSSQIRGQSPGLHSLPLAAVRFSSGNYILDFAAGPYMIRKAIAVMR